MRTSFLSRQLFRGLNADKLSPRTVTPRANADKLSMRTVTPRTNADKLSVASQSTEKCGQFSVPRKTLPDISRMLTLRRTRQFSFSAGTRANSKSWGGDTTAGTADASAVPWRQTACFVGIIRSSEPEGGGWMDDVEVLLAWMPDGSSIRFDASVLAILCLCFWMHICSCSRGARIDSSRRRTGCGGTLRNACATIHLANSCVQFDPCFSFFILHKYLESGTAYLRFCFQRNLWAHSRKVKLSLVLIGWMGWQTLCSPSFQPMRLLQGILLLCFPYLFPAYARICVQYCVNCVNSMFSDKLWKFPASVFHIFRDAFWAAFSL